MNLKNKHSKCSRRGVELISIAGFVLVAAFSVNSQAMNVLAISDFNNGLDGWTGYQCGNFGLCPIDFPGIGGDESIAANDKFFRETVPDPFFHTTTLNTGGNLHGVDPESDFTVLFNAPEKFLNNLTLGTTLMFDMFVDGTSYDDAGLGIAPLFYVSNGQSTTNGQSVIVYAVPLDEVPVGEWLSFAIDILPNVGGVPGANGGWYSVGLTGVQGEDNTKFGEIFDNAGLATELRIWGELTEDSGDNDGVLLDNVKITTPIPVPAALPLMLSALAGFGFAARRKKT